tara:strand:+ start:101 stop:298 length:198 start_codon:yes stop_codon:yes gene_type:complete
MSAPLIAYLIIRETAQEEGERERLAYHNTSADGDRDISIDICIYRCNILKMKRLNFLQNWKWYFD